ncbi:MAG: protease inhibitor I42 family protein [Burkholderiaceae bacterium]|nr:protease inhibitor I42 family protein [Burkholderiaceae bacterium]
MAETLLTREHDGQTVIAPVGSTLVLVLDESPTTGHVWVDRSEGGGLTAAGDEFSPARAGVAGAGGEHRFRWRVLQPGIHRLQLALVQPWAGGAPPADRYTVTVHAVAT